MEKNKIPDLTALASIPLVMTLANSMLIPVLPVMERELGISDFQSSMIITVYSISSIMLIPVAGYLSDIFGRKKVMIPCLAIAALGAAVSGIACWLMEQPYPLIIAGRIVQGIGASGAFPVVMPTVGDMFKLEKDVSQGLGIIETSNTFGKVLSPILGAALALPLWYLPFLSIPVIIAASIIMVLFMVKVNKKDSQKNNTKFKDFISEVTHIFRENCRWLASVFAGGFICMFVLFGFLFYLSSVLEDSFGLKGIVKGLVIAIPLLFLCTASLVAGNKINRDKKLMKGIIIAASFVTAVSIFWTGFSGSLPVIMVVLTVAGTGIGAALPCLDAMITEGIRKVNRGTISSLYSGMRLLGVATGPPLTALLLKSGQKVPFYVLSAAAAACALAAIILVNPREVQKQPDGSE